MAAYPGMLTTQPESAWRCLWKRHHKLRQPLCHLSRDSDRFLSCSPSIRHNQATLCHFGISSFWTAPSVLDLVSARLRPGMQTPMMYAQCGCMAGYRWRCWSLWKGHGWRAAYTAHGFSHSFHDSGIRTLTSVPNARSRHVERSKDPLEETRRMDDFANSAPKTWAFNV